MTKHYPLKLIKLFHRCSFIIIMAILILVTGTINLLAQLDKAIQAHGGLEKFREFGTVEYDLRNWPFGKNAPLTDHQVIDLQSRNVFIKSDDYTIGFDGNDVWISPDSKTLGLPARFYAFTPYYFFGLPFLFADPGVRLESLGTKKLDSKEYDVVKISFGAGVGDTPEDNYVAYFDKDSKRLRLAHYIVTYPLFMEGKQPDQLERHAIVYDEWQEIDGLTVPKKVSFYGWEDEKLVPSSTAPSYSYDNVKFKKERPSPKLFAKPKGTEVDLSHKLK